jgi:hypothetical protein
MDNIIPKNNRLDIKWCFQEPRLPHLAQGRRIQQLTTNAIKTTTWVAQGVKNKLPIWPRLPTFDQSKDKLRNPIPPSPPPMKLAVGLLGATQQMNDRDDRNGKTNSGRNCQRVTPISARKNTNICLLETGEGDCLCFVWVSNKAV